MMNQAPTKANYYYIDCRGGNSLRPFFIIMNCGNIHERVEPWVFIVITNECQVLTLMIGMRLSGEL